MNSLWGHVIWCSNCTNREGGMREGRMEGERGEGRREGERVREDIGGKKTKVRGGR